MLQARQPVGIFDSGIGGLTVARAICQRLPHETLVYFGDTAHLPYGDKSEAAIQAYSIRIADFLLRQDCKVIVIACNSASSAAYHLLKEYVRNQAQVINVIDPMVAWIGPHYQHKTVGLIGTKRTVQSGVYQRKLAEISPHIVLQPVATPLLAPMIEEGYHHNKISRDLLEEYLGRPELKNISALVLACTHYPLIKDEIQAYLGHGVDVLDSSQQVAGALYHHLHQNGLLARETAPVHRFFVSDYTDAFEASTRLFFGEPVRLQLQKLWE